MLSTDESHNVKYFFEKKKLNFKKSHCQCCLHPWTWKGCWGCEMHLQWWCNFSLVSLWAVPSGPSSMPSSAMWLDLTNGILANMIKLEKSLHIEIYLLGAFGNQSRNEEARATLADVRNEQSSCPFYPSQTPEMWVRPSGTNTLTTTSSLTDHDHINEPRNCRRTTQLSPDQIANPTELWVNKWWMF